MTQNENQKYNIKQKVTKIRKSFSFLFVFENTFTENSNI